MTLRTRKRAARIGKYLLLFAASFMTILPVYWMLTVSLKTDSDTFSVPPVWIRFTPTARHFQEIFVYKSFGRYLLTSAVVAAASTTIALVVGTLAAYALARFSLPGKLAERLSFWIASTRMLPPIVTVIPLFMMIRDARLLDTISALVLVYAGFNLPFVVWMMRGFFEELPREIEEAAVMDGDSRLGALRRILLPLVTPGLAATAVFCLITCWNEFLFALILTQTDASITLPVAISGQVTQYEIRWGAMSAAGITAIVPVLVFAFAVQRYLVRGLSLGAVKG